jgi:outer membrane protein OmpA-like peptidoglycan-associated protein
MEAYFANMALSQDRTRAVLEYSLTQTQLAPALKEWARKRITANGLSSSRPREIDGREDKDASRRVEFRVLTKAKEQLLRIVEPSAQ